MALRKVWELSVAALVIGAVSAQYTGDPCSDGGQVNAPADVASLFNNCSTISGDIYIAADYSGSFIVPDNVTWINATVLTNSAGAAVESHLTSFQAPNVTRIAGLSLWNAPNLSVMSAPKVTEVGFIELVTNTTGASVHFPSLVAAKYITLSGPITEINFDALVNITGSFNIDHTAESASPLPLSFPSLAHAQQLYAKGTFHNLSAPNLRTVGPPWDEWEHAVSLSLTENPAEVSFPKLNDTEGTLDFEGTIKSLSLPALTWIDYDVTIKTEEKMNLSLALTYVGRILTIQGDIQSIQLPPLISILNLKVESALIDCQALANSLGDGCRFFTCNGEEVKPAPPSVKKSTIVAVVVSIIGIALIVGVLVYVNCHPGKNRFFAVTQPWRQGPDPTASGRPTSEPPPVYEPPPPAYQPRMDSAGTSSQSLVRNQQ